MVNLNRYSLHRLSDITTSPPEQNRLSVISTEFQTLPAMEENKPHNGSSASRSLEDSFAGHEGGISLSTSSDAVNDLKTGNKDTEAAAAAADPSSGGETDNYLPIGPRLFLIVASLMLAVFCMALDNTIIAVAIPQITDDFHALNDVGWYASGYLLTGCAFQLLFGKFYTLFNVKWVLLSALFVFELGSLVCAVAPSSTALIVGRAVAGLGSAGIFTGAFVVIAHTVALEKRPAYLGIIGGMYGIASVAGPLMGGAFTQHLTWRWCFYINLPLGGVTAAGLIFLLRLKPAKRDGNVPPMAVLKMLDPVGNFIFVPAIICLLLALQWGGVQYAWSNARIIALFVLFGVILIVFVVLQVHLGDIATVPVRIASQRTIASSSLFGICIGGSFFIYIYYIPIWFQAIKGTSPVRAGIDSLALILAEIVAIVASGAIVTKTGHYAPFFIASSAIMSIGAGLCNLFTVETSQAQWVGFTFLYGFGVGLGFQQGSVAAQAVLKFKDVPIGTATVLFVQILGGALFVAVAQNLFTTHLISGLIELKIPGLDPNVIIHAGATGLRAVVDPARLPEVLVVYNDAIVKTFQLGLILSCLSILGAVGVEWKSIKASQTMAGAA